MAFSVQTVEKRRYIFFQERGRDWETKRFPAVGIHFRRGKQHVSRHFYADGTYCLYIQESRQNPDFDDRVSTFSTP